MFFNKKKKIPLNLNSKDIHNHILPGVDDGFQSVKDSIEAVRRLKDAGVNEIVFTPHLNPELFGDQNEDTIRRAYEDFACQIPSAWGVKTSLAAEYMIIKDFEKRSADPSLLLYDDGESILVEMSYFYRSPNLEDTVFNLLMDGRKPILAHPERYLYMLDELSTFDTLADSGCRFQMNYLSLTGVYGRDSLKILNYLKSRDLYSFCATDLHSLRQLEEIRKIKVPDI